MGSERKNSSSRLHIRVSLKPEDRSTLIPCPACEGAGTRLQEMGNRYRANICKWCEGIGLVDQKVFKMFRRWLALYHRGLLTGRCVVMKK